MAFLHLHIHKTPKKVLGLISKQFEILTSIIMGKFEDVKAEFDGLKADIAEEKQQISNKLETLGNKITQLETNILEGGTTEERAALIADIKAEREGIKAIIPDLPPPVVEDGEGAGSGENV